jgi:hypothetical protein
MMDKLTTGMQTLEEQIEEMGVGQGNSEFARDAETWKPGGLR